MIGLIDWGIGGLGVLQTLRKKGNRNDVVYFSDSGCTPYGKMTRGDLRERFHCISDFLVKHNCEKVFVACNAASSAIEGDVEVFGQLPFYSFIPNVITFVLSSHYDRIALIGGTQTINSGVYQSVLGNSGKTIVYHSAQPLSALVERGLVDGPEVETEIKKIMINIPIVEAVVFACTHYPALEKTFKKLYPHVDFLDPSEGVEIEYREEERGEINFYTTGEVGAALVSAKKAFGIDVDKRNCSKVLI